MSAVAFDTLRFARALREKAKLSTEQADGMAEAISDAVQGDLATKSDIETLQALTRSDIEALRLSTKSDIEALRLSTRSDIEALRLSTKADIETAKAETIRWVMGTIGFQTLAIIGAILALARIGLR